MLYPVTLEDSNPAVIAAEYGFEPDYLVGDRNSLDHFPVREPLFKFEQFPALADYLHDAGEWFLSPSVLMVNHRNSPKPGFEGFPHSFVVVGQTWLAHFLIIPPHSISKSESFNIAAAQNENGLFPKPASYALLTR
ncbi:MAG: hypothetical protein OEZ04_11320, partial [Nitrospinota bacterium]|nr:hypothetical protein [Nitrospinota bacterium]